MITLQGGNFQNNEGVLVSYGYLTFKLNTDSFVTANPFGQVVSGITTTISLDKLANVQGTDTFLITTIQVLNNELIVGSSPVLTSMLGVGDTVVFPTGLAASFLNNAQVTVTSVSANQFTANFTNANYGPISETSKNCTIGVVQNIWSNAELTPSGTSYIVNLYNQAGTKIWSNSKILVFSQSSGSIVSLSNISFASGPAQVSYPGAVLLMPVGNQTITGFNLYPANGNTTQSLGSLAAPWVANLSNTTIVSGATLTVQDTTQGFTQTQIGPGSTGASSVFISNNANAGAYNPIVSLHDTVLAFGGSANTSSVLDIVPYSGSSIGIKIPYAGPVGIYGGLVLNGTTGGATLVSQATGGSLILQLPNSIPTSGQALVVTGVLGSTITLGWNSFISTFNQIGSGTNTSATMTIGTGGTLTFSGSGIVNASQINGVTVSNTPTIGKYLIATSGTGASWQSSTNSFVNPGYIEIPGFGLVIQWGSTAVPVTGTTFNFPVAFPNNCLIGVASDSSSSGSGGFQLVSASQFILNVSHNSTYNWIAIGY